MNDAEDHERPDEAKPANQMTTTSLFAVLFSLPCPLPQDFGPENTIGSSAPIARHIGVADIDGDGIDDVICASETTGSIGWFRNDGAGHFDGIRVISSEVAGVVSIELADFDLDGDIDVLAASPERGTVSWFVNDGPGVFGVERVVANHLGARSVQIADLNGDGFRDLLVSFTGGCAIYLSAGSLALLSPAIVAFPGTTDSMLVGVADIDLDGVIDLVASSTVGAEDTFSWLPGLTAGGFGALRPILSLPRSSHGVVGEAPVSGLLNDLDGDGLVDLLYVGSGRRQIEYSLNLGNGSFANYALQGSSNKQWASAAIVDLDGDSVRDILAATTGETYWCRGLGGASFAALQQLSSTGALALEVADLNGDITADILSSNYRQASLELRIGLGSAAFSPAVELTDAVVSPMDVAVVDLDGDLDLDVVVASGNQSGLDWFENDGFGQFGRKQTVTPTIGPVQVSVNDVDLDGDLDIIVGAFLEAKLIQNLGSSDFSPPVGIGALDIFSPGIAVGDLDGDLLVDVVAYNFGLVWSRNLGGGLFGPQQQLGSTGGSSYLRISDIDADSDLDVLVSFSDRLIFRENLGGGVFGPERLIDTSFGAGLFDMSDIDSDGIADLVVCASNGQILLYRGVGGGAFTPPTGLTQGASSSRLLRLIDIDQDGDIDLLTSTSATRELGWIENRGNGSLAPVRAVLGGSESLSRIAVGDLDRDGREDVILLSRLGDRLSWRQNLGPRDCDSNGLSDSQEIAADPSLDCDSDGELDQCELARGEETDCDGNGVLDRCDIATGNLVDCDIDGIPDLCQIALDPGLDIDSNGLLDSCELVGLPFCSPAIPNSTQAPAFLAAIGSNALQVNGLKLAARGLPAGTFAMFVVSRTQGYLFPLPNSIGALCLDGALGRFNRPGQILSSGTTGSVLLPVDLTEIPTPSGLVAATVGENWNFQAWYRDSYFTGNTSNFTDAVSVTMQ